MKNRKIYPPFSVVMSVYKNDNPEYFHKALYSIWNQTIQPSEIILVVDGPIPDKLNEIIQMVEEEQMPLRIFRLKENRGLGNALRIAVEKCQYELIARMDSDDISVNDRFEQLLDCFEKDKTLGVVGGDIEEFIDGTGEKAGIRKVPTTNSELYSYLKRRCPFNHVTVMYKKSAILSVGNYKHFPWNEDYYLWIRLYEKGIHFANTGTVLVNVRVGSDMYKRRGGIKYFRSECAIQKYMLQKRIIGVGTFLLNVVKRLIVQVLLPNSVRGFVFQTFAREKVTKS